MIPSTRHRVPTPWKQMLPQILTLTFGVLDGGTHSGLSASSTFLYIYTRLLFPISTLLSPVKITLSHWRATCQFFRSLHQSTRFFLLTSRTTIFFFETRLWYPFWWSTRCKILHETGLSKLSLNVFVTSLKGTCLDFFNRPQQCSLTPVPQNSSPARSL